MSQTWPASSAMTSMPKNSKCRGDTYHAHKNEEMLVVTQYCALTSAYDEQPNTCAHNKVLPRQRTQNWNNIHFE
jgi:hypothetical protein